MRPGQTEIEEKITFSTNFIYRKLLTNTTQYLDIKMIYLQKKSEDKRKSFDVL
jgi:hypothetical protein